MSLTQSPVRTLLAVLLMGLLFTFPIGFSLFYKNISLAAHSFEKSPKVLLFLNGGLSEQQAQELQSRIQERADVEKTVYISPLAGIKNLAEQLGLGTLLDKLSTNPLPSVIEVLPSHSLTSVNEVTELVDALKTLPEVASVQVNMTLVKQQYAYLNFWQKIYCSVLIFSAIVLLLASSFIMQTFYLAHFIHTREQKFDSLILSGIVISVLGALLGALIAAMVFKWMAGSLQIFLGIPVQSFDFWLIFNLLLAAIASGILGTVLAGLLGVASPEQSVRKA